MEKKHISLLGAVMLASPLLAQAPGEYKGTPFNGPHVVPGTLEAEDFDEGGEGISWHDSDGVNQGGNNYRGAGCGVDIERNINIGFTNDGEWLSYTLEVAEDGAYTVETYCCGPNGNGSFHLEMDGKVVTRSIKAPVVSDWGDFSRCASAVVQLRKGVHVMRWYTYGGMNVDRFEFTRSGEYDETSVPGNFNYPITKVSANPLFVNFDSPMYGSDGIGALYTADPSAHVWEDGRLYVYASHDMEPAMGCDRMDRYHIFSTDDMVNWTDHGEILSSDDVEWGRPSGGFMWAPDCAYRDGKYYFYFPHPSGENWNETWRIGVAVSDKPAEGFKVAGYIEGAPAEIDPCVFIDDDGQAYIYNGGGNRCFGGKLKDNMMELDGEMRRMEGLEDFHEGTWVHKYNGTYYLSYADNHNHDYRDGNRLRYAMSDSPLGPWKSVDAYLLPTGCDTSHGSIVEYKGKWYAFYHASNYSGQGNLRSVCFDELKYNADGTIRIVHNWGEPFGGTAPEVTADGVTIEAEEFNEGPYHSAYFRHDGREMEIATEGDRRFVERLERGEWARYSCRVAEPGFYDIVFTVKGLEGGSSFYIAPNTVSLTSPVGVAQGDWREVTVKNVPLKSDVEYLDIRVNGGAIAFDRIEVRPAPPYEGTPYAANKVPGRIEAENFDLGGEGVAFYNGVTGNQNNQVGSSYRKDAEGKKADMERNNGGIVLNWMNDSKWFRYTVDCETAGTYDVTACVSYQEGSTGYVTMSILTDDYRSEAYAGRGWSTFKKDLKFPDAVPLRKGKNVIEVRTGMNFDYLQFTLNTPQSGIEDIASEEDAYVDVYTADGKILKRHVARSVALEGLPKGLYIAGGRKIVK